MKIIQQDVKYKPQTYEHRKCGTIFEYEPSDLTINIYGDKVLSCPKCKAVVCPPSKEWERA